MVRQWVQFSRSVVCDSLQPHGLQLTRLPCPSPNSQSLLRLMCIELVLPSSYLILCCSLLLLPSVFPVTQFFTSGGQSIGVSASTSVLPVNIQGWFLLGLTGWISLQSRRLDSESHRLSVLSGETCDWHKEKGACLLKLGRLLHLLR